MSIPEPPTNVRIVMQDHSEYPVEVAYRGQRDDGTHEWIVTTSLRGIPLGLAFDRIPPRTAVMLEFEP